MSRYIIHYISDVLAGDYRLIIRFYLVKGEGEEGRRAPAEVPSLCSEEDKVIRMRFEDGRVSSLLASY